MGTSRCSLNHVAADCASLLAVCNSPATVFQRVLVANRGEIAIRVARTCHKLGIEPIGVYSGADVHSLHRRFMDDDLLLGPAPPSESYLSVDKIVGAARAL